MRDTRKLQVAIKALLDIIDTHPVDHDDEDGTCDCPTHIAENAIKTIDEEDEL